MDPLFDAAAPDGGRPSERRLIENEKLARAANERYEERVREARAEVDEEELDRPIEFFCECADPACRARIAAPVDVYDQVHAAPDRFMIAPGHYRVRVERVIARTDRYLVVEKERV